ncbi:MAG: hypothetical protein TE42_05345, partial [Candidatus Synechococcus spongiarum SP3]
VTVTGQDDAEADGYQFYGITFSLSSSDQNYNEIDVTALSVSVKNIDNDEEKVEAVLDDVVLPSVVQQLTAHTTEAITSRLTSIASGPPVGSVTISMDKVLSDTAAFLHGRRDQLNNGHLQWEQVLSGRNFGGPLSGVALAEGEGNMAEGHPFSSLALWGRGDYSRYNNTIENTDVAGGGFSGTVGIDVQPMPRLVTGLALTATRWGLDYNTNGDQADGAYKVGVAMVNPYVNWFATDQLSLWGTFGYGRGEVEQTPEEGGGASRTDTDSLTSWAGGVRFQALPGGDPLTGEGSPFGLAFKLDGARSSFLDANVQLARLAGEVSRSFSLDAGLLTAALDLGWSFRSVTSNDDLDELRQSVADQNDSGGAELVGSVNWLNSEGSVSATVDARLLVGSGDHKEWGIGGNLRFTPSRRGGEGLSLSLQPSIGVTRTRLDALWSISGEGDLAISNRLTGARLHGELAYGFRRGNAVLTPYSEVVLDETASSYGVGLRYDLNGSLDLDLKGARRHANGNNETRLFLHVRSEL